MLSKQEILEEVKSIESKEDLFEYFSDNNFEKAKEFFLTETSEENQWKKLYIELRMQPEPKKFLENYLKQNG